MTGLVITPLLVPPVAPAADHRAPSPRRALPLAAMPPVRPPDAAVYGMAAMDDRGRITDRPVLRALGWTPGTRTHVHVRHDIAIVTARSDGPHAVTAHGHLRLPVPVRHRLDLRPGDRMLLAAIPAEARLIVYPPAALDALLAASDLASGGQP